MGNIFVSFLFPGKKKKLRNKLCCSFKIWANDTWDVSSSVIRQSRLSHELLEFAYVGNFLPFSMKLSGWEDFHQSCVKFQELFKFTFCFVWRKSSMDDHELLITYRDEHWSLVKLFVTWSSTEALTSLAIYNSKINEKTQNIIDNWQQ